MTSLEGCAYQRLVQAIPRSVGTAIVRERPLVREVYRSIRHATGTLTAPEAADPSFEFVLPVCLDSIAGR